MGGFIPTQEFIKDRLSYNPDSGEFTWLLNSYRRRVGSRACKLNNKGYYRIFIDGRSYLSHRLAWLYTYGRWPDVIDHINRITTDNRIVNLREVTNAENQRNRGLTARNRSGFNGVGYVNRDSRWYARIYDNTKTFRHLGYFKTKEEAVAAREAANIFYGYHPNHGKILSQGEHTQ